MRAALTRFSWLVLAIVALCSCTTPATQVIIQLDTDLPESRTVVVRVTASQFDNDGGAFGRPTNWTFTRGGPLGEHQLPGTFGVNPASDAARDARVQLVVSVFVAANSVNEPSLFFRRTVRFRFTPHRTLNLGVFLSLQCAEPAVGCTSVSGGDCTVGTLCEERGLTCGDHAECVSGEVTPVDSEAGFPDSGPAITPDANDIGVATDSGPPITCGSDTDCAGWPNGRCDVTARRCVECLATADCAMSRSGSVCNATEHRCVPCGVSSDCAGSTEGSVCNLATGRCAACGSSADCAGADAGHVCSLATGLCVPCARDTDCIGHPSGPVCDTAAGRCVACTATADRCASNQHCDAASGTCVAGCHDDSGCLLPSARHCDAGTHACVACVDDSHCPPGSHCASGTCAPGCSSAAQCSPGQSCCAGSCADTLSSESSCGACGTACAPANAIGVCASGSCAIAECTAPFVDCNESASDGCEVNVLTSPMNCGICGRTCIAGPNSTAMCAAGVCSRACATGFADCNGDPSDGCEVRLANDVANCGSCAHACSVDNGTAACVAGICTVASCNAGFGDCDGSYLYGCEANTMADPFNCGACGNVCTRPPGAVGPSCASGVCTWTCGNNHGDCDGIAANGCEEDLWTSVTHCGMCGRSCSFPHANPFCEGAACAIRSCVPGYGDCDGSNVNGCETDLTSTLSACGACNNPCNPVSNGTRACVSSLCVTTCAPRYGDCDGVIANGCESGPVDQFPVAGCTNIAASATVTGSPIYGPPFQFTNAIDGNICSRGVFGNTAGTMTFDWGAPRSMRGFTMIPVILYDGSSGVSIRYDLSTSVDGTTFTPRTSFTVAPNETHFVDFGSNQSFRAIRFDVIVTGFPYAGIGELYVHQCP